MELTKEQANAKLKSSRNILNALGIDNGAKEKLTPRPVNRPNYKPPNSIPPVVKSTVAVLTRMGECNAEVARTFGISERHVGKIEKGTTSVPEAKVEMHLDRIREKVVGVIENALLHITDDKLANNSAANNSTIIRNLFPLLGKAEDAVQQTPQVIVYAPQVRDERSYSIIEN